MWKKILLGIAGLVVILLVVVSMQPATYHVERSAQITAPAEIVWAQVSDFDAWESWSPWAEGDPTQKTTNKGDAGAVGHSSSWEGEKTGTGIMTITSANKPKRLDFEIEFFSPMAGVATIAIDIEQSGDASTVTWSMDGDNDFMGKAFGLFMNMDEMIGSQYEEGLAKLKTIGEAEAKKQAVAPAQ